MKESKWYKWEVLLLLWMAYLLNQGDRQVFNTVLPAIRDALNLTDTSVGLIATIFNLFYAVMVPVGGWGFFRAFFDGNIYDVTPERLHASYSSAMIMTGFAAGAFAPVILGSMKQSIGSLSATFPILAAVWLVSGILVLIVAKTSYNKDYSKQRSN